MMRNNCFCSGGEDSTIKCWDIRNSGTDFYTFRDQMSPVSKLCKVDFG